ncbi:MAG: hypothetical protein VKK59_03135 [Vampirovibrionales bacterium]|nr:hypothetical protein [Vampirovibrionales bacterium]
MPSNVTMDTVSKARPLAESAAGSHTASQPLQASSITAQISFAQLMLAQAETTMLAESSKNLTNCPQDALKSSLENKIASASTFSMQPPSVSELAPKSPESSEVNPPVDPKPIAKASEDEPAPSQSTHKGDTPSVVLPAVAVWFPTSALRAEPSTMSLQAALSPASFATRQVIAETLGGGSRQAQLSEKMQNALAMAHKYGRSVRIDINRDTQLIFRLSKGLVSAEFLSQGSGLLVSSLSGQLETLKARLQEQNLPVDTLTIREDTPQGQKHHGQKNPDDNDAE